MLLSLAPLGSTFKSRYPSPMLRKTQGRRMHGIARQLVSSKYKVRRWRHHWVIEGETEAISLSENCHL